MKKEISVKLTPGHWHGTRSNGWKLTINDESSGLLICEITLTPDQFYRVMASYGGTEARATVFDSFDDIGKGLEISQFVLQDDRLKNHTCEHVAVVESRLSDIESDGWKCDLPHSLSQGQLDTQKGTIKLILRRYVEQAP